MNPLIALALFSQQAQASNVSVTFCATYTTYYADASSAVHDDWFTSNSNHYYAGGARIKVIRNSDSVEVFNAYATNGTHSNCTSSITLNTANTYTVELWARASVNNNTIVKNSGGTATWYGVIYASYTPPSGGETNTFHTPIHEAWNIAASAGWAMTHHNGGMSGQTVEFRSGNSENKFYRNGPYIHIQNDDKKYTIVHEMGHWLEYGTNGNDPDTTFESYGADEDGCTSPGSGGHHFNSKEYQKAAVVEGLASFYAQVTFNDEGETDCYYERSGVDWDRSGDASNDDNDISCEGGPYRYGNSGPIDSGDYLGDYCLSSGESNNRGTQYDWMRFFWDLDTNGGLTYGQIMSIWADANPDTMYITGDGSGSSCIFRTAYPANRLRCAADSNGFLTDWDNWDTFNGVYR